MKTLILCNSDILALPTVKMLNETDLVAVAMTRKSESVLLPSFLQSGINKEKIHILSKATLDSELSNLILSTHAELVLVLTFPWKIPSCVLSIPDAKFVNFHFGLLPKYKGSDPVFWQLKNRESKGGITAHIITDEIDNGPILIKEELPVIPGETYGIHCQRLGVLAEKLIAKIPHLIEEENFLDNSTKEGQFFKAPSEADITINWQLHTADEIEWLVNACNPKYGGAITSIRGMKLRLLEVAPADVNNAAEAKPGTIVYADVTYGLIVACKSGFLKINIVTLSEGYMSGIKLFQLGFNIGEIFY